MNEPPRKLTLEEWDSHYARLAENGLSQPSYGGPLSRHLSQAGDLRLRQLCFDNSVAALRLWNLLLTENDRLHQARRDGEKLVGAMKDLGTVPVLAYSFPGVRAFYPDGAWWTPCLMECSDGLLERAGALGIDATFCPVRAMLGAFATEEHFPRPDLLICSAGAVCDDFSAIAQRLEFLGHPVFWWEMPRRRRPDSEELGLELPGALVAPSSQVEAVRLELERVAAELGRLAGRPAAAELFVEGVRAANEVRRLLRELRQLVYDAPGAPLPALEMQVAEMLAIHFCSDRAETVRVLSDLVQTARARRRAGLWVVDESAVRLFWVNPVADLRSLNAVEGWGGRICGSDYMFGHALELIPEDLTPLEALARTALADPMVGSTQERAARVVADCRQFRAEALVVSRIPGASHSALEGTIIREVVQTELGLPSIELEIPPVIDATLPSVQTRLVALIETARTRRT